MNELSLHILDIAENSVRAGASLVRIVVTEDALFGIMMITVSDNGSGMSEEEICRALDPFYSTKSERPKHIGLGLPLLKSTAEQCGGGIDIRSRPGEGTAVYVTLPMCHIDCPPMGDFNETIAVLIAGNPSVDFDVTYMVDGVKEHFSTRDDFSESAQNRDEGLKTTGR